ncbi:MAG: SusE domain-containing protein [Sediminicola sp.]
MKILTKHILPLFAVLILLGCGGNKDDDQSIVPPDKEPETSNSAPSVPVLIYPGNGLLCIDNQLEFTWEASMDADGDPISYTVQVANDEQFTDIVSETISTGTKTVILLEKGKTLYWRVLATDVQTNISDYSPSWKFYTEGEAIVNQLPFPPELVSPALNETVSATSTTLSWHGTDPDNDDLSYDVYFGTVPNAPLVSENVTINSYQAQLSPNSFYYWGIVIKDGAGGTTFGPVWSFRTE